MGERTESKGTVVVTGGAGRVGRHVVAELAREGFAVRVADLVVLEGAAESVRCDVLDPAQVRAAVEGADAVCHLAGLDYDVEASGGEYLRVNAVGSWNVLAAAAAAGARKVVLASSSSSYGVLDLSAAWLPQYLPLDEAHPQHPYAGYSLSKKALEEVGRSWARAAGIEVVALQPLHVVSRESLEDFLAFVRDADPGWIHNYVVAADVAAAFRQAVEARLPGARSYLIGAADTPLAEPTLDWYAERIGPPPLRRPDLYEADPRASVFSLERAGRELGWAPRLTLADLGAAPVPAAELRPAASRS